MAGTVNTAAASHVLAALSVGDEVFDAGAQFEMNVVSGQCGLDLACHFGIERREHHRK